MAVPAKFQWKEWDLKGPPGAAAEAQVLLVTCTPEHPPWMSWFKSEKTAEFNAGSGE